MLRIITTLIVLSLANITYADRVPKFVNIDQIRVPIGQRRFAHEKAIDPKRWKYSEHLSFLVALTRGLSPKKTIELIQTKNSFQRRSHLQKYLNSVEVIFNKDKNFIFYEFCKRLINFSPLYRNKFSKYYKHKIWVNLYVLADVAAEQDYL